MMDSRELKKRKQFVQLEFNNLNKIFMANSYLCEWEILMIKIEKINKIGLIRNNKQR